MNKDTESWRRVSVEAVMSGGRAQGENVLRMAIEDILQLDAASIEQIESLHWRKARDAASKRELRTALEDAVMWWEGVELLKQESGRAISFAADYAPSWLNAALDILDDEIGDD